MEGQTNCNSCSGRLTEAELGGEPQGERGTLLCAACLKIAGRLRKGRWNLVHPWNDGWEGVRLASRAPVPWQDSRVALIRVTRTGTVHAVHTLTGKRRELTDAAADDLLLIAWPGQGRQDVFVIDDRRAALKALQPAKRRQPA